MKPRRRIEYSSTLPLTSELDGGRRSKPGSARFTPGIYPLLILKVAGRTQGPSGQAQKISPSPGFDPRTVQPVAGRYTD